MTDTSIRPPSGVSSNDGDDARTQLRAAERASAETLIRPPPTAGAGDDAATLFRPRDEGAPEDATALRPATHSALTGGGRLPPVSTAGAAEQGATIGGRYRLEERLGHGGMGEVWRAVDLLRAQAGDPRSEVAIKLLTADFESHPSAHVTLQRESARAMQLAHPNIATVHAFDMDAATGRAFLCMELLEGTTLDDVIRQHPQGIEPAKALRIIRDIGAGLAYAHAKGIVHCDLKPGNAFLLRNGSSKILDFGIARVVRGAEIEDTFDAGSLGALTPAYATREMEQGAEAHPADDVYALGLIAYELLTGRHPYARKSASEAGAPVVKLSPRNGLSRREVSAISRAISLERPARFKDAAAFLEALARPNPWIRGLAVVALALAIAAGYASYRSYREAQPQVPFEALPAEVQAEFRESMNQANAGMEYVLKEQNKDLGTGVLYHDVILGYSQAYDLHPRNAEADTALRRALDELSRRLATADPATRREALAVLQEYQGRFPALARYEPMTDLMQAMAASP